MNAGNANDHLPFNTDALGAMSRRLAEAVFSLWPELRDHAYMQAAGESDGLSLKITVPSPTKDPERLLGFFICEQGAPSIGFGPDHTHATADQDGIAEIIDIAKAIFADNLLIIEDVGGKYPGHAKWIDLRDAAALEEELTNPFSPGKALLKSWSGRADRNVSVENLQT
jgi:hypothetical protein